MKRIIIAITAVALLAGACSKPEEIGKGVGGLGSSTIPSSKPPSTKPPVKKTTKAPPKTVAPDPGYKGRTYAMKIRTSADGYEPREYVVFVGDTITFQNLDPNQKHTFTGDKNEWDSGELSAGDKPYAFKVNLAPGDYSFHCELVPYVLGGPIRVMAAPK